MTPHISAAQGAYAETILLPGDPLRAKWAAEHFLNDIVCVNEVRGMLGFTGVWQGHRVSIQGTGMGMPSMSIYANELITQYGAQTLIRVGSCGAMQPHVAVRDIVIAMTATTLSSPSRAIMKEVNYAPCADWELLQQAYHAATVKDVSTHVGGIYSSDTFYDERGDLSAIMERHGILAVEMEAAELYTLAARHGRRALAILTVSDHLKTHEALPPQERQSSFADMMSIALEAAFPS